MEEEDEEREEPQLIADLGNAQTWRLSLEVHQVLCLHITEEGVTFLPMGVDSVHKVFITHAQLKAASMLAINYAGHMEEIYGSSRQVIHSFDELPDVLTQDPFGGENAPEEGNKEYPY